MKKLFILLLFVLTSCKKDASLISETTSLKSLPEYFFTENSIQEIEADGKSRQYVSVFGRFPNTEFSKFHLKKHPETYMPYFNVTLNLNEQHIITLEGVPVLKEELISYTKDYIDFAAEGKQTMIHLNFEENIALKDYLSFINFVQPIVSNDIVFNSKVFTYNKKSLPDCNCTL